MRIQKIYSFMEEQLLQYLYYVILILKKYLLQYHVPLFIKNALNGDDIIIHGDGKQTRSMAYVGDVVKGLI